MDPDFVLERIGWSTPISVAAKGERQLNPVAKFEIPYTRFLDEDANPTQELPGFAKDSETMIALYRMMMLTRAFDKKAIALQRTGKLGTYPSSLGQEAVSVALGSAMIPDDVLFPYYREYGAQFWRGVTMTEILLYWGGDERGMDYSGPRKDFPICVPIASHGPHAVGAAYAMQLRKESRAAVYVCGDGATSKGDFYEAVNAAGVWKLPMVFIVNNNQWAISIPRTAQTGAQTIAQKALAGGFSGEQVDGNDIVALRHCMQRALEKARSGGGPSMIEAITYRLCDHTTADDASRYRSQEEWDQHWKVEPVARLKKYMTAQGWWDDTKEETLISQCAAQIEQAVQAYLDTPAQAPETMFDYMFASLPHDLAKQRDYLISRKK